MISTQEKQRLCQQCKHRRNYFCKRHGDEWRRIVKERSFCEGWGNVEAITMPRPSKLAVMVPIFDPTESEVLWKNYRRFRESLPDVTVFVAEVSYTGKFHEPAATIKIHANENQVLWQKERLLNLLLEKVPHEYDAVAWIDSDLIFENRNWLYETLDQLAKHHAVQLYERVDYIGSDGRVEKSLPSYGKAIETGKRSYFPGGAWAARRSSIKDGLHDESIVGGGDKVQLKQWIKQGLSIGYTSGVVRHLYHGDYANRQHLSRQEVLKRNQFDSNRDIKLDQNGLWSWQSGKQTLCREVREFFEKRLQIRSVPAKALKNDKYDIDVFMPYYRNLHLVPQTVDSILWQTGVEPFIHLVNDCSGEDDRHLFARYGHLDNVAWYKTKKNSGPYAIANSLFYRMKSDFIGIADSDDIYFPGHFRTALTDLAEHDAQAWGSVMTQFLNPLENHTKQNIGLEKNHPIADSGKKVGLPYPRLVNGTMVVRRSTFQNLNGFNGAWHCAADTEFSQRLQFPSDAVSGHNKTAFFSPEITALRRICGNSLSNSAGKYGLRSQERDAIKEESLKRYDLWKKQLENHGKITNPSRWGTLDSQDDVLDADYKPSLHREGKIIACLASIPRRMYALGETVASLIDQVDMLKVHLNEYSHIPEFLKNPKIEIIHGDNSLMSCTKFLWSDRVEGYIFTCDDDLIYPADYVKKMKAAIDKYKCIVCAHGSRLDPGKLESYYKNRVVFDARKEVSETVPVDVPGTGVMAWHTDDIKLSMADFDLPGMEDIAAYRAIYKNSYRAMVVAHPDGWFKSSTHKNDGGLYSDSVRDDSEETEVINAHKNHR